MEKLQIKQHKLCEDNDVMLTSSSFSKMFILFDAVLRFSSSICISDNKFYILKGSDQMSYFQKIQLTASHIVLETT